MNNTDITHIYHISDLHIRNIQRHKEYRAVFRKFLKQVKTDNIKNSVIYIAGDIAHAKTEMSPELVQEISWFFTECANLRDTFIIAGNHDCFTPNHEVLTKTGWITFADYVNNSKKDDVATFNINNSEIEFQTPIANIKKRYKVNLIHLKGKDIEQIVTPTHNILYTYSHYPNKFYKKTAKDIKINTPIPLNGIVNNYIPNIYAKLLGFSFADGTFVLKNKKTGSCRIQFHLKKQRKIKYLSNLLDELNYSYNINVQSDGTVYINIYSTLAKNIYNFFDGKKEIPIEILNKNLSFYRSFIDGYLHGDGNTSRGNYWRFSSINKNSVDILFTIARLAGYTSRLNKSVIVGKYTNSKQQYHASCTDSNKIRNSIIKEINLIDYDDDVYCLTVPNDNLLIRYKDKISISGNCNLNNNYRLDVLTPIVENLNNPKLHYLRETGIYPFKNLNWVVYSIMDNKINWPNGYDINMKNKICCFHGPVNKAQTDIGYTVASNSFIVDMFDGFQISMLGDIHKRQLLQKFSEEYMEIDEDDLQLYLDKGWIVDK